MELCRPGTSERWEGALIMFKNTGRKIKRLAVLLFILGVLLSAAVGWLTYTLFPRQLPGLPEGLELPAAILAGLILLLIHFIIALLLYGYGQLIDTAEDIADSNDRIVSQMNDLKKTVEQLPVLPMDSRFSRNAPASSLPSRNDPDPACEGREEVPWQCPECGNMNPGSVTKCAACGQTGLWQCEKCGRINPCSVDVCTECGALDVWKCPSCGEKNPRKNPSCSNCGKKRLPV